MNPRRSILDKRFRYVPAVATSVADTWREFGWRPHAEALRSDEARADGGELILSPDSHAFRCLTYVQQRRALTRYLESLGAETLAPRCGLE